MSETSSPQPPIQLMELKPEHLERLGDIDRSEHVVATYVVRGGALERVPADEQVPRWRESRGDHSVEGNIAFCRRVLDGGGEGVSALRAGKLVGIALLRHGLRPATAQLAYLYVSREVRRTGLARRLAGHAYLRARSRGARHIYVSATPTESAVSFYRSEGFVLTEPDPVLLEQEPLDIHLLRPLGGRGPEPREGDGTA